jgi:hypothetical protein
MGFVEECEEKAVILMWAHGWDIGQISAALFGNPLETEKVKRILENHLKSIIKI